MGHPRTERLEERIARELLLALLMSVLALLQATLLPSLLGFPPILVLVVVVCRALVGLGAANPQADVLVAIRWAFYSGLALDLLSATLLGTHVLALLLALLLVLLLMGRLEVGGAALPLLAVLLGATAYEAMLGLVYHLTIAHLDWMQHAQVVVVPSVLLALVPTLPVFHMLAWSLRRHELRY